MKKGLVFVVSAPAGTGKTTLVRMLQNEFPNVVESISFTTRAIRPQEISGRDYFYITHDQFEQKIRANEFLEYAKVFGHYYGTCINVIEENQKNGNHVVLVIDTQGAMEIKKKLDAIFIFIRPPNLLILKERLSARKSETAEDIEVRLLWAEKEMSFASHYDYEIVNDRLDHAYDLLRAIVIAEMHRNRQKKMDNSG